MNLWPAIRLSEAILKTPPTRVATLGTFDLLHPGHEYLFKRCAEYGEVHVGVNTDRFVRAYKTRIPIENELVRYANVGACGLVDRVYLNDGPGDELIRKVQPNLLVIGSDWVDRDYLGQLNITRATLEELRCDLLYIARIPGWSTTALREACWCCGEPAPIRGEGDPWEGRLDGYCESCATTRCDTTDSTCAVKGRAKGFAA